MILERSTPELQGISSQKIIDFLSSIEERQLEIHSLMIVRNGKIITEAEFKPYQKELPHTLFSLSKSFTSTAIGFAVSEGLLRVEDKLIDLFPGDVPNQIDEHLASLRIKDLLTMNTGHEKDTLEMLVTANNPIKTFLNIPMKYKPSTHFMYHNGATYILAHILHRLTNMSLVDYLMPRLFEPLGISIPYWEEDSHGVNFGAWGLYLKVEDIAKFGLLYLNKGVYNGKRIIREEWIDEATRKQVENGTDTNSDWSQGYGYQFWRCRHHVYRGDGAFGQYCIVMPQVNTVISINSGLDDMQPILNLIWEHLLPSFTDSSIEANEKDYIKLQEKISQSEHLPKYKNQLKSINKFQQAYIMKENKIKLNKLSIDFENYKIRLSDHRGDFEIQFGLGSWVYNDTLFFDQFSTVFSSGAWIDKNSFMIESKVIQTPFTYYLKLTFNQDEIKLDYSTNLSFNPDKNIASLKGKMMI